MRTMMGLALSVGAGAWALGGAALQPAQAADITVPPAQVEAPPPAYAPPPVAQAYPYPPQPPPVVYGYPPPPVAYYSYAAPPYAIVPGPYFVRGLYWRGYAPRFAYGYGYWRRGWRRW